MTITKNELNAKSIEQELNLAPLEELLTTGIEPRQLAEELDELMFDYVQTIFYLHHRREPGEDFIHEKAPDFIFYLRELRNVFWECVEND